jgi:hypothetical protein
MMVICRINDWKSIDNLSSYPKLTQLRISQIPLFEGKGASEVRPLVIGHIEQLQVFNGSNISERERRDAEKIYLRYILRYYEIKLDIDGNIIDIMKNINDENNDMTSKIQMILMDHPRFHNLRLQYGNELMNIVSNQLCHGGNLEAMLITIQLKNMSIQSLSQLKSTDEKKLPLNLTIKKLRIMIKQLYQIDMNKQLLSLRMYHDALPVMLDDDDATLAYYGAIDHSEIFVNESE